MKLSNECTAYNQYIDTNVERLIQNLCKVIDKYNTLYYNSFIQYVQLKEATGEALDERGKLLNFNRNIVFNDPLNVVIPTTEGIDEYEVLYDDFKRCRLGDDAYRRVLMLLAQTRNTASSVTNLSKVISDTIDADVFVGDNMDMNYITYYFLDRIPGWLEVSMHNYDILPRPAGMSVKYISAISRFFGFLIQYPRPDFEATAKVFSPFWKTRFPTIFRDPKFNSFLDNVGFYYHKFSEISEEHFNTIKEDRTRIMNAEKEALLTNLENTYNVLKSQQEDRNLIPKLNIPERESPSFIWAQAMNDLNIKGNPNPALYGAFQSKLKTLQRWNKRRDDLYKYQDRVLKKEHEDIRKYLYYDKKTKWYYYKPAEGNGEFNPLFQTGIYQDTCGVWFMQDTLTQAASKGYVTLRSIDYAQTHHTKTLPTSPYNVKFSPLLMSCRPDIPADFPKPRNMDLDSCVLLANILDNMHTAIAVWHKTRLFDAPSFRAVLDFEFRNLSIIQRRDDLKRIMTNTKNPYEARFYREQYDMYNAYLGKTTDRWSLDEEAPIYQEKQWLIYLRSSVRKARDKLSQLYNATADYINKLPESVRQELPRDMARQITLMRSDLGDEHFTDFEKSRGFGGNYSSESQIYLANYYLNAKIEREEEARGRAERNIAIRNYAIEQCDASINNCKYNVGWSQASACFLKVEIDDRWPDWHGTCNWSENCNSWYTKNVYEKGSGWFADDVNIGQRGCLSGRGNATFWSYRDAQRNKKYEWERDRDRRNETLKRLYKERSIRSELTRNDNLRYIVDLYNNADPKIEFPSADYQILPINDFTII